MEGQFTIMKDVLRLLTCTHTKVRSVVVVSSWGDGSVMFASRDERLPTKHKQEKYHEE